MADLHLASEITVPIKISIYFSIHFSAKKHNYVIFTIDRGIYCNLMGHLGVLICLRDKHMLKKLIKPTAVNLFKNMTTKFNLTRGNFM